MQLRGVFLGSGAEELALLWTIDPEQADLFGFALVHDSNRVAINDAHHLPDKLGTGFEADYFNFQPRVGSSSDLWSLGGWVWYDFTSKFGVAFRGPGWTPPGVSESEATRG